MPWTLLCRHVFLRVVFLSFQDFNRLWTFHITDSVQAVVDAVNENRARRKALAAEAAALRGDGEAGARLQNGV